MNQTRGGIAVTVAGLSLLAWMASGQVSTGGEQLYRGYVVPNRLVKLAAPIEEILLSVEVKESDRVKAGQLLAEMDYWLQEVVVEAAEVRAASTADIERAKLDIEDATLTHDRITDAFDSNAANELAVRRAKINLGAAEAAHTAAQENKLLAEVNLRLEQRRLERYKIKAPFDGTVVEILSDPGAMLNENEDVLVLADLDTLEAHLNLPVELYGRLELGKSYMLVADEPINDELTSRLDRINPLIDTASRTFRCVFVLDNPGATLPAGFTVHLRWPQ